LLAHRRSGCSKCRRSSPNGRPKSRSSNWASRRILLQYLNSGQRCRRNLHILATCLRNYCPTRLCLRTRTLPTRMLVPWPRRICSRLCLRIILLRLKWRLWR
jgi:hypothetical protein